MSCALSDGVMMDPNFCYATGGVELLPPAFSSICDDGGYLHPPVSPVEGVCM